MLLNKQDLKLTLKSTWLGGIRTGPGPLGPPGYLGDIKGCKRKKKIIKPRITALITNQEI